MTDIDDRLRDAFGALDRAVSVPPLASAPVRTRRMPPVLLAAAAIAVIAGVVSLLVFVDTDPDDIGVAAQSLAPAEFDSRVATVCTVARSSRPAPTFATVEAYRVVARDTLGTLASMQASLRSTPPPTDDAGLVTSVLDDLAVAESAARDVLDVADEGRVDALSAVWERVNTYFDLALGKLAAHGAAECAP